MSPSSRRGWPRSFALLGALVLGGCAPMQPQERAARPARRAAPTTIAPNANLVVQGIPPIPKSVADAVARYNDFRGHGFVDWHPTKREMLVSWRKAGGNTTQIFRVAAPGAEPEQLTDFPDPVRNASYEPTDGASIVFERSTGGDEAAQIYRLDLATRRRHPGFQSGLRNDMQGWLHRSSRLLYLSVPLDRTAAGGSRAEIAQTLMLVDPAHPETRRKLAELPGGGWYVGGVSWDDRRSR